MNLMQYAQLCDKRDAQRRRVESLRSELQAEQDKLERLDRAIFDEHQVLRAEGMRNAVRTT